MYALLGLSVPRCKPLLWRYSSRRAATSAVADAFCATGALASARDFKSAGSVAGPAAEGAVVCAIAAWLPIRSKNIQYVFMFSPSRYQPIPGLFDRLAIGS